MNAFLGGSKEWILGLISLLLMFVGRWGVNWVSFGLVVMLIGRILVAIFGYLLLAWEVSFEWLVSHPLLFYQIYNTLPSKLTALGLTKRLE